MTVRIYLMINKMFKSFSKSFASELYLPPFKQISRNTYIKIIKFGSSDNSPLWFLLLLVRLKIPLL